MVSFLTLLATLREVSVTNVSAGKFSRKFNIPVTKSVIIWFQSFPGICECADILGKYH